MGMQSILTAKLVFLLSFLPGICSGHVILKTPSAQRSGAVASESKECSQVGIDLLKRGGNAADALVGTSLCVGVIGMHHSGIGGGGFMLIRDSNGDYESMDFRETAPAAAFQDMYEGNVKGSVLGGLASGVPGEILGLETLHQKYGVLPWQAVVNPSVHIARYGFRVTEDLVRYMDSAMSPSNRFLVDDPVWAIDFAPNGTLVQLNDVLTRPRYADTLEQIGEYGSKAFYEGEIANYTIAALQARNGTMTLDDLRDYKVAMRKPISIDYRDHKIYSCGAPSGGSTALSILKIIEGYDMNDPDLLQLNTHRIDEAMRYSYAARTHLGDPDFFDYMDEFETKMIRPETSSEIRRKISDKHTHNVSDYNPQGYDITENHGTSHIVTADGSGMTITFTSTVNLLFGSQLMVPETGVIMNNEMNDFSIPRVTNEFGFVPSPINYIRPKKRPLSSITPIIVERSDGSLYLSIGAAGGSRIITATVQGVWHVLDHGMTLAESLRQPRLHDQLLPAQSMFEWTYDNDTVKSMSVRGHNISWVGPYLSAVQGVRVLGNGTLEAASEPRQLNSGGLTI